MDTDRLRRMISSRDRGSDLSGDDDDDDGSGDYDPSRRFADGYSVSADVSESESDISSVATFSSSRNTRDRRSPNTTSSSTSGGALGNLGCLTPPSIMHPVIGGRHVGSAGEKPETDGIQTPEPSEAAMMKERFAKLLLGEDMSGGGKGVTTALAISNAITNLAATVYGELWKLEPLSLQRRSMWRREMEWLLCVSDSIVELVPSVQEFPGGRSFEIMVPQQRSDLYINLPALKKLDAMLVSILDGFQDPEFYYVDRGVVVGDVEHMLANPCSSPCSRRPSITQEEKWWLPFPKVPANGLSHETRKHLQQCKEFTHQIFKAAVAINNNILSGMEVPQTYLEGLPKSEKTCLGETLHRYITADKFSPDCLFEYLDLSSEYSTLDIANRLENGIHFWRQKYQKKKLTHTKSALFWGNTAKGSMSDIEKCKVFAHRADTLLKNLKLQFPGLPQTALDMSKIQYNKDVGYAILESYSRVMESLAFNLMARIDDLLYVDEATKQRALMAESLSSLCQRRDFIGGSRDHFQEAQVSHGSLSCSCSSSEAGSPLCSSVPRTFRNKISLRRSISQPASGNHLNMGLGNVAF